MCEDVTYERIINIRAEDLKPVTITRLNLPDLAEEACYETEDGGYCLIRCVPSRRKEQICPVCHRSRLNTHGYVQPERIVHDVNIGLKRVDLIIKVPRYRCLECGHTFAHRFASIAEKHRMTIRLLDLLKRESFVGPFERTAYLYGYTPTNIANIFDEYASELDAKYQRKTAPRILGIDEKHIGNALRGVLTDIEKGYILEMTPANTRENMIGAIESLVGYDEKIEIVTMDMSSGYRSYVQECLPRAKIIVDKFHVFQLMGSKVTATRTNIIKYLSEYLDALPSNQQKRRMMQIFSTANKDHYLFKYGSEKIQEEVVRTSLMAELCQTFPEFNHLRLIKEGFERIYQATSREAAEKVYQEWLSLIPPSGSRQQEEWQQKYGLEPELYSNLRVFANTMKNWHNEIFGYFDPGCNVTNAATEGLNRMIENINRSGNGYSFNRLRKKALYHHIADPVPIYKLDVRQIPVYDPPGSSTNTIGYTNFMPLDPPVVRYREERFVIEVPSSQPPRQPLSVFQYLAE